MLLVYSTITNRKTIYSLLTCGVGVGSIVLLTHHMVRFLNYYFTHSRWHDSWWRVHLSQIGLESLIYELDFAVIFALPPWQCQNCYALATILDNSSSTRTKSCYFFFFFFCDFLNLHRKLSTLQILHSKNLFNTLYPHQNKFLIKIFFQHAVLFKIPLFQTMSSILKKKEKKKSLKKERGGGLGCWGEEIPIGNIAFAIHINMNLDK